MELSIRFCVLPPLGDGRGDIGEVILYLMVFKKKLMVVILLLLENGMHGSILEGNLAGYV